MTLGVCRAMAVSAKRAGADVNARRGASTPLRAAILSGSVDTVKILLRCVGVKVNDAKIFKKFLSQHGNEHLDVATTALEAAMVSAAATKNVDIITALLDFPDLDIDRGLFPPCNDGVALEEGQTFVLLSQLESKGVHVRADKKLLDACAAGNIKEARDALVRNFRIHLFLCI